MTERPRGTLDCGRPAGESSAARPRRPDRALSRPGDQLPELGDWDGPIYGELGILTVDGDGRVCRHIYG